MSDKFLDKVYTKLNSDETKAIYDAWADSYEAEIAANGYVTPRRCAEALAACVEDLSAPMLDFGCGTGLSGLALRLAGFSTIDGRDLSDGMIAQAKTKAVYRTLETIQADEPLPEGYTAISAIGVIGLGGAPLNVLDRMIAALPSGGLAVFSFNDHTLSDPSYEGRVDRLIADGIVRERFREYGEHLPKKNMKSTVYVIEKT